MRAGGEGATEDKMVGWHHWLNGHEFEQIPGDSEGQGRRMLQFLGSQRVGHDLVRYKKCTSVPKKKKKKKFKGRQQNSDTQ